MGQIFHAATHQEFSFSEELLQCRRNSQESHCIHFSNLLDSFSIPKIHLESILPDLVVRRRNTVKSSLWLLYQSHLRAQYKLSWRDLGKHSKDTLTTDITGGVRVYCYLETLHQIIFHLPCLSFYWLGKELYLLLLNIFNSQNIFFIVLLAKSELEQKDLV